MRLLPGSPQLSVVAEMVNLIGILFEISAGYVLSITYHSSRCTIGH